MTKWVEEIALPKSMEEAIINFLFELFVQYRLSREVIIDGRSQFTTDNILATLQNYHIKHIIVYPYHPQTNKQLERTNKVLEAILMKTISLNHRNWETKLPEALWAN